MRRYQAVASATPNGDVVPMAPVDMSPTLAKIKALKQMAKHWGDVVMQDLAPEAERLALSRASSVRTKTGKPSRLGPALLRRPSVDPLYQWQPRQPLGGQLQMSGWARRATGSMFTFTAQDRAHLLKLGITRLKSWRRH